MIVCKTDEQKSTVFRDVASEGFIWFTPMYLDSDRVWDDTDIPQVEDNCPHCGLLTDRNFNCTSSIDGWVWYLHNCLSCDAVWFEKELV